MKLNKLLLALALAFSTGAFSQISNQEIMQKNIKSKTIVFIHGLFLNNQSWKDWKDFFEAKGYTCYTPSNPGHEGNPAHLRANPPAGLEDITLEDWITNLEKFIDKLPERPILIGHSFGGLTAQKLVESGRAEAAILISTAPPKGIISLKPGFWKANNKVLNVFKGQTIFNPKEETYKKWFHFAIANTMTREMSDKEFERYAVPESRRTHRSSLRKVANVSTKKPHVPLLFLGGLKDVIVPNGLVRKNVRKYKDKNSIVDSRYFEGKDHFICGAPGWEDVANYAYEWINR